MIKIKISFSAAASNADKMILSNMTFFGTSTDMALAFSAEEYDSTEYQLTDRAQRIIGMQMGWGKNGFPCVKVFLTIM